ncbi:Sugar phosphate isomerase/epimerase [Cohnella sp. OV330]|uniref:sugar phosphate isomerase/epimerase family protein n=1 Tax=Cohnella sp. OV330 TaxID=1855288 RepID=UPI0008EECF7B|nr:sugar phosphate isomerase/epimerase [Cohnella sp. OV330]SFB50570.1 Sugar phosphate isomerase/epimerase [Cohnella sp. OV330]
MSKVPAYRRGIFAKDLCGPAFGLEEAVEAAVRHGYAGVHLGSPASVSPALDGGELEAARRRALSAGVTLGVSIGALNPYQPSRSEQALQAGGGDLATGVLKLAEAGLRLGQTDAMLSVGTEYDRFNRSVEWSEQLRAVAAFLKRVQPDLRSLGARVLVKSHQEITSWELRRLLDELDPDVFGAALDPVNLIVRMEDPLAAAARLAGRIGQVHMDDAMLVWTGGGAGEGAFGRMLCPLGRGCIDWPALIAAVEETDPDAWYWGEIHRAELTMPFARAGWFDDHPDLGLAEFASWASKSQQPGSFAGSYPAPIQGAVAPEGFLLGDVPSRVRAVASFHGLPDGASPI